MTKPNTCGTCKNWVLRWTVPDRKVSALLTEKGGDLGYCEISSYELRLPLWMYGIARELEPPITGPDAGEGCPLWEAE